jgi:hypothetical protein
MKNEPEKKPKKPPPKKMTPAEQSRAFIKKAREIGVDETGQEFEAALKTLIPPRTVKQNSD